MKAIIYPENPVMVVNNCENFITRANGMNYSFDNVPATAATVLDAKIKGAIECFVRNMDGTYYMIVKADNVKFE